MRLNNSEDTASKLVVSILDMESFFGFILSDSMIFNSFFNYTFICKKWVSELRRFGTTGAEEEGLYSLKCKPGRGVKSFLTSKQLSELRKALSEPILTDDGFSRGWQTKDAIQFVREKFGISYSKSRMRQIIKNLGFSRITCRLQSKRRNAALTNEFIAEIKKRLLNPNHLFVTQDESGFCVDSNISKYW